MSCLYITQVVTKHLRNKWKYSLTTHLAKPELSTFVQSILQNYKQNMVSFFLKWCADFFNNCGSTTQIITKLEVKLHHCPIRYDFGKILQIFTFSASFKALELASTLFIPIVFEQKILIFVLANIGVIAPPCPFKCPQLSSLGHENGNDTIVGDTCIKRKTGRDGLS